MFRNLLRILAILLIFAFIRYLIWAVRKALSGKPQSAAHPGDSKARSAGELLRDPVCGTFVSADTAITTTARGVTHHFCSAACRDKFLAA
jgi:YHS domain-containing protein